MLIFLLIIAAAIFLSALWQVMALLDIAQPAEVAYRTIALWLGIVIAMAFVLGSLFEKVLP